jgi:hypothetical protein
MRGEMGIACDMWKKWVLIGEIGRASVKYENRIEIVLTEMD